MPVFILLGWLLGVFAGLVVAPLALVMVGVPVATLVGALVGTPFALLAPLIAAVLAAFPSLVGVFAGALAGLSALLLALVAVLIIFIATLPVFLLGYVVATRAITPLLPAATGTPGLAFPLTGPIGVPAGVPVVIPPTPGESFARGLIIGFNATVNALLLLMLTVFDPVWAPRAAIYAFVVISLAAVAFVARLGVYQGLLGWSAWFFPVSWVATLAGLLLFIFNALAWMVTQNQAFSVTLDFTTGVFETTDGFILNLSNFAGGFSLGNFTFMMREPVTALFTVQSVSSHETGHSLNTAAGGGVVLWINAIDENVAPFARFNLAYGELLAESHSAGMPVGAVPRIDYSVAQW